MKIIKFSAHEIPTRKRFESTKYPREKMFDPQSPTRKNFGSTKYPRKKCLSHKVPRKNILNPRNTNEKIFWTHEGTMARWRSTHETHDGSRRTEFSTLVSDFAIVQASKLTKNDSFCRYFAKTLSRRTEQLFSRTLFWWLIQKILKYAIVYCISRHCFSCFVFAWYWRNKKVTKFK